MNEGGPINSQARTHDPAGSVLSVLYDRGDAFISRDELVAAAGLRRGQLEEALAELRRRGQQVEQSPAHGLRLSGPVRPHPLLIEKGLGTRRVGGSVICFDEVESTNDVAFDSARSGADGLAVLAESQRRGRGRLGRTWLSSSGANVLISVLLIGRASPPAPEPLTIAAGLAASEALDAFGAESRLKWPNDVLLDGAKAAGVMVEIRGRAAVVGFGVNVNAAPPPSEVDFPATCLADSLGHPVERIELVRELLRRLDAWVEHVDADRLEGLAEAFAARCDTLNRRVTVRHGGREHVGRAIDVSPFEGLVLLCDDGRRLHLPAAGSTILNWR